MSGLRTLKKGEILFREGDPSDAMYVIKTGKIAITKTKGSSEIKLAELGPGDMLGEMAFFDSKPRSAGAKAMADATIIELPFKALNAQFKTFPEWLKAIVRTVNSHLRNANTKIKNLEKTNEEDTQVFPAHTVTRLMAILGLVTTRFGEKTPEGINVQYNTLRRYTIQVFQQSTSKMDKLMEILQGLGYMKVEDLGEGRIKLTVFDNDFIVNFTNYYNDWLFKSEDKKYSIDKRELKPMKALVHFAKKETPSAKGEVTLNLTKVQAECIKELSYPFSVDDTNSLSEKNVIPEKSAGEGGLFLKFNPTEIEQITPYWELIHLLKEMQKEKD